MFRDAEIIFQRGFDFRFAKAGIADLDFGVEVTLLGREQRAAAVHLDAAAFNDERFGHGIRHGKVFCAKRARRFRELSCPCASCGTWPSR